MENEIGAIVFMLGFITLGMFYVISNALKANTKKELKMTWVDLWIVFFPLTLVILIIKLLYMFVNYIISDGFETYFLEIGFITMLIFLLAITIFSLYVFYIFYKNAKGKSLKKIGHNHFIFKDKNQTLELKKDTIGSIVVYGFFDEMSPSKNLFTFFEATEFILKNGESLIINSFVVDTEYFMNEFQGIEKKMKQIPLKFLLSTK